jgi:threonine aldolase
MNALSNQPTVDFRSDTVTRPSAEMRAAMAEAPVGDDVWGDDPSVQELEASVARQAGKEAALFFPSGTQSNLAALMAHCERGDEYIVGQEAHTYKFEGGGAAVLGSIQPQPIEHDPDGSLPLAKIRAAIKPDDMHFARTRLLALENTIGGRVLDPAYVKAAGALARSAGLAFHLDGARAWNAAIASGVTIGEICRPFDSVSLCFSKGLGAPVGSVLVGNGALIDRARRWRKVLGGGMRQSGLLARACTHALDHHLAGLADDHAKARLLADGLQNLPGITLAYTATNMVVLDIAPNLLAPLTEALRGAGILARIASRSRLVTHRDIPEDGIARTLAVFAAVTADVAEGKAGAAATLPVAGAY